VAIEGDCIVPELKVSCLRVPGHGMYARKSEYLESFGSGDCKRFGRLKNDFPRQFPVLRRNERTLANWLSGWTFKSPKPEGIRAAACHRNGKFEL
jgi:hypothetical protein